jgi:hypothetical protein
MLLPPKILNWDWNLAQTYCSKQRVLVTSGCSFTASTQQTMSAASWPGFVRDRCRFDYAVDMSYPGMGNDYIRESIMDQVTPDCLVIVMWSGIDRRAVSFLPPISMTTCALQDAEKIQTAKMSLSMVQQLKKNLTEKNIPHAFTQYINLIYPPFLPKRDTTPVWAKYLNRTELEEVKNLIDIPNNPQHFLYDYAFFNKFLDNGDQFHPPVECNLKWTDSVLLPELAKKGLISVI